MDKTLHHFTIIVLFLIPRTCRTPASPTPSACNIATEYDIVCSVDRHQEFLARLALNALSLVQYYMFRGGGEE